MTETVCNWDFYKIPTIEILQYRTAFYNLRRRNDQSIEQWLKRVRELIGYCKFPLFFKYLLMDRFICGLNIVEIQKIQSVGKFSTLEELLEILSGKNKQPKINSAIDNNVNQNKNKPALNSVGLFVIRIFSIKFKIKKHIKIFLASINFVCVYLY